MAKSDCDACPHNKDFDGEGYRTCGLIKCPLIIRDEALEEAAGVMVGTKDEFMKHSSEYRRGVHAKEEAIRAMKGER